MEYNKNILKRIIENILHTTINIEGVFEVPMGVRVGKSPLIYIQYSLISDNKVRVHAISIYVYNDEVKKLREEKLNTLINGI